MARGYHKSTARRALPSGRSSAFQSSLRPKVSSRWLKLTHSRAPRYGTRSPSAIRVSFGSNQGRSARITTWPPSMCDSTGNARGRIADRQLACRHWSNTSSKSRWNCSSWRWNCLSSRNGLPARGLLSRTFERRRLQRVPAVNARAQHHAGASLSTVARCCLRRSCTNDDGCGASGGQV